MSAPVIRRFAELPAVPWANGGGTTTELVTFPESITFSSAGPRWRLSVARLDRPGAFSPLQGIRRTFLPVGGTVVLDVDGVRHECRDGRPFAFDGDADTRLASLSAPCHAVNLMVERTPGDDSPTLVVGPTNAGVPLVVVALADGDGISMFDLFRPGAGSSLAAATVLGRAGMSPGPRSRVI